MIPLPQKWEQPARGSEEGAALYDRTEFDRATG